MKNNTNTTPSGRLEKRGSTANRRPSRRRSLKWRINLILATGTGVVAVTATMFISGFLVDQLREGMEMKAKALSTLLAKNLSAAVDFDDSTAAADTLTGLKQDGEFKYAVVTKSDGSNFVKLGWMPKGVVSKVGSSRSLIMFEKNGMIHVAQPIVSSQRTVGLVQIGFSLAHIHSRSLRIRIIGVIACAVLILLLTTYFAYAMNRTIVQPITQMIGFVQKIGEGDLREQVFSAHSSQETEEIALMREALTSTTESFRDNVKLIQQASGEFATIADDILAASSQLSNQAVRQVDSVMAAFATSKKMESAGEETAHNAMDISTAAETSVEVSGDGLQVVSDSVEQFHGVTEQVQIIVEAVDGLNAQLSQMDAIIRSVADISRQSQLLAVNASIEAAKAREAGLRFGVVAREIKNLAAQSKTATDVVRSTLGNVKQGIMSIAEVSDKGRRRASRGLVSIETSGQIITRLAEVINSTARAAKQITVNTNHQVVGLKEMSGVMFQIDDLSKSNLGAVRRIEQHGEKLNAKAVEMEKLVSTFRIG